MKKFRTKIRTVSVLLSLNLFLASCSNSVNDALDNLGDNPNKIENTTQGVTSITAQEYSGEELFKSVFFAYGDFAKHISMHHDIIAKISAAPADQHDAFLARFDHFAKAVKENNPIYFEKFKTDILSGDNATIQNAIKYGSISIYENVGILMPELQPVITKLEEDQEIDDMVAAGGEITQDELDILNEKYQRFLSDNYQMEPAACSWAVACVLYAALAVHNTVALTANLAVAGAIAVYLGVKWWGPKLDSPKRGKSLMNQDILKFEMFVQEIADASTI